MRVTLTRTMKQERRACLANRFLFLFLRIVFVNKNNKLFSIVFFSVKKRLTNYF
jgi:hypothetical protein